MVPNPGRCVMGSHALIGWRLVSSDEGLSGVVAFALARLVPVPSNISALAGAAAVSGSGLPAYPGMLLVVSGEMPG